MVLPLDHRADALAAGRVHDRIDDQGEIPAADLQVCGVGGAQLPEHAALVGRVLVEQVDALADHSLGRERGQILADVGLGFEQHPAERVVDVADVEIRIGDHHVGRRDVQRLDGARALAQPVADVVERLGDGRLLARQPVHVDTEVAPRIAGGNVHHFHLDVDVGLDERIDGARDFSERPVVIGGIEAVVDGALAVAAHHVGDGTLQLFGGAFDLRISK